MKLLFRCATILLVLVLASCSYESPFDGLSCQPEGLAEDGRVCVDGYWQRVDQPDGGECTPETCQSLGAECGSVDDGCGRTLDCGMCSPELICSANQICVDPDCQPSSCEDLGAQCGEIDDGCGGTVACDDQCGPFDTCSPQNQCVACVPRTCEEMDYMCGTLDDGCGQTLTCGDGDCPQNFACNQGVCECDIVETCRDHQIGCGSFVDGCGQEIVCEEGCFLRISAGERHACAIRSDGTMACWGDNNRRQLGRSGGAQSRPVTLERVGWRRVSAGGFTTCAVSNDEFAYCWGDNRSQEVPGQTEQMVATPILIDSLTNVTAIATGQRFACAVANGSVECWGENSFQQISSSSDAMQPPTQVDLASLANLADIRAGAEHVCALGDSLMCWGSNRVRSIVDNDDETVFPPQLVPTASGDLQAAALGLFHTCSVAGGELVCHGASVYERDTIISAAQVSYNESVDSQVIGLDASNYHTCYRKSAGVYCRGLNDFGQLAGQTPAQDDEFVEIPLDAAPLDVAVGSDFACAIVSRAERPGGEVFCWGRNQSGQLGRGATSPFESTPAAVVP